MKPFWMSATFGTVALGIVAAIPAYVPQIVPFVPPGWQNGLKLIAVLCGLVSSVLARKGAANESQEKLLSLASSVSEHVADTGDPVRAAQIVNSVKSEGGAG